MLSRSNFVVSRWTSRLPPFVRRAVEVDQMELDSALSQMYSLCTCPSLVSKMSRARKMTKGHYFRDDPAFLVLQLIFIVVVSIAYWLLLDISASLSTLVFFHVLSFAASALVMASVGRAVAVIYLSPASLPTHDRDTLTSAASDSLARYLQLDVEWRYAFDVHCNGYFTFFMWTQVMTFFLAPLMKWSWVSNTLTAVGAATYLYNVFLGYLEIPSLSHQQRLLYPVLVVAVLWFLLSALGVNIGAALCLLWRVDFDPARQGR